MAFKIREIFQALAEARVDYVVVGGFAVILHGHARATRDLDLVVELSPANCQRAIAALSGIGLRPRLPVPMSDLADPAKREEWRRRRNMIAFPLWDEANPERIVEIFVYEPMAFEQMRAQAVLQHLDGIPIPIASIEHLIAMKKEAGRPHDRQDIEALRRLAGEADEETE